MEVEAIDRIERELSVKLPERFRAILEDYPFSEDSFGYLCMLFDDADTLIEANRGAGAHFMLHHRKGRWLPTKAHLLIGNDGGEEQYYLDIESENHPVLKFDLETGVLEPFAPDIDAYIAKAHAIDRQIDEEERIAEARRRSAKWWEFWKKV